MVLKRAADQHHTHQVPGQLAQLSVVQTKKGTEPGECGADLLPFIVPPCDYPCTRAGGDLPLGPRCPGVGSGKVSLGGKHIIRRGWSCVCACAHRVYYLVSYL